jgi:hypothetical protein
MPSVTRCRRYASQASSAVLSAFAATSMASKPGSG